MQIANFSSVLNWYLATTSSALKALPLYNVQPQGQSSATLSPQAPTLSALSLGASHIHLPPGNEATALPPSSSFGHQGLANSTATVNRHCSPR